MSEKLKPCPFCGSEAEIERYGNGKVSTVYRCTSCSCFLETTETWGHGTDWNHRHQEQDPSSTFERWVNK